MDPLNVISTILAVQAQDTLAHSALPNAPVVPDRAPRAHHVRRGVAGALHRVADAIAPAPAPAAARCRPGGLHAS